MDSMILETLDSGVTPIEVEYSPVISVSDDIPHMLYSVVRINSVDLGVLYPDQYRLVSNWDDQCERLTAWTFRRVLSKLSLLENNMLVIMYLPAKMLGEPFDKLLRAISQKNRQLLSRLVLEFSGEILVGDPFAVSRKLNGYTREYGIRSILSQYGEEYCPVMRLSLFPFQYVLIDKSLCTGSSEISDAVTSVCGYAVSLGKKCIFPAGSVVYSDSQLANAGIEFYIGKGQDDTEEASL